MPFEVVDKQKQYDVMSRLRQISADTAMQLLLTIPDETQLSKALLERFYNAFINPETGDALLQRWRRAVIRSKQTNDWSLAVCTACQV